MSLDKAIEHGKEYRKPYKGAKAIDHTCRNHGSCEWCKGNRTYKFRKVETRMVSEKELIKELWNCRNELCLRCGKYENAHKGACEDCRYNFENMEKYKRDGKE